ncbi:MAG: hypothetical protein AMJ65_10185 [Phycisphaerae bacterium SG8_4]|nr:MAG: hypothetical protein AMJ65_10185 [Phycisphaerae bacterium SG8_4]
MKNCTLFVASCDKYHQAWKPFFFFVKKHWPDFSMPVILNTETKSFTYEGFDIKTFSLYKECQDVPWGKRMLDHLDKVETDYILWMLEDYFLRSDVDEGKLNRLIDLLDGNKDISTLNLIHAPIGYAKKKRLGDFVLRPRKGRFKFSTTGLWRVSHLKEYILPHENPWEWEVEGDYRSAFTKNRFYMRAEDAEPYLDYGFSYDWMGIRKGKWVIEDVGPLFEANGLKVDFDELGIYHRPEQVRLRPRINPTLRKRISMFLAQFKPKYIKRRIETARKYRMAKQQVDNMKM